MPTKQSTRVEGGGRPGRHGDIKPSASRRQPEGQLASMEDNEDEDEKIEDVWECDGQRGHVETTAQQRLSDAAYTWWYEGCVGEAVKA